MSLYERAQKTKNPNLTKGQIMINAQKKHSANENNDAAILHKQVQKQISAETLSKYMLTNPKRAMAEIRNAANNCFLDRYWDKYSDDYKKELVNNLINYMCGFGPIETLLDDPGVTEVMVNGTRSVYYEKSGKLHKFKQKFSNDEQVRALVDRILGPLGRRIDESSPMVNARLDAGHRVHVIIPPLSIDGTILTIRKFSENVISLEEMEQSDTLDKNIYKFLTWSILMKKNIAVSGGTGSGKTTLLNAMSCKILHSERVITIEDSAELRFLNHPHVVRLEARPINSEGKGEVTIRDLVINSLRMRPDRIVVGECRGAEALDMLQAMNTGHDGSLTTLHANSPKEVITRLTTMVRYAVDLPVDVIENYIATAIDIVIQTARGIEGKRYISDIVSFSYNKKIRKCEVINVFHRGPFDKHGKWFCVPSWIDDIPKYNYSSSKEVKAWVCSIMS